DAVLKRNDDRVRTDERRQRRQRAFRVVELHGEEHDIDWTDRSWIISGRYVLNMHVAAGTFDSKTMLAHGRQMRAARDERHVCAPGRQPPAKITANAAAPKDRYPHGAHSIYFAGPPEGGPHRSRGVRL